MQNTHTLKLIDGSFTADEAFKVLSVLINSKINYHSIESFSHKERFNKLDLKNNRRLQELKEVYKYLELITRNAKDNNLDFVIESDIKITLINSEV